MLNAASDADRGTPVDVGPVTIWADVCGPDDATTVVLLAGADSPGFRWTPAVVEPLLAEGYRVVRFDHRDCGRSTHLGPDSAYKLDDLASDTLALMTRLGIDRAHLIGRSMGGMVAQVMAMTDPGRVASLTLVGTTAGAGDERLPGPDDDFVEQMMVRLFEGPPSEDDVRQQWIVDLQRILCGPLYPFDDVAQNDLARAEIVTGWAPETGHGVAVHSSDSRVDVLDSISAPTLVVHGSADPVYPSQHGRVLAEGIPGAVLIEVEGLGHEFPDRLFDDLWAVLRLHLSESERAADHL